MFHIKYQCPHVRTAGCTTKSIWRDHAQLIWISTYAYGRRTMTSNSWKLAAPNAWVTNFIVSSLCEKMQRFHFPVAWCGFSVSPKTFSCETQRQSEQWASVTPALQQIIVVPFASRTHLQVSDQNLCEGIAVRIPYSQIIICNANVHALKINTCGFDAYVF